MTIIARRFASVPARSAVDTWKAIVGLIAPRPNSPARQELDAVAGVACSIIASEVSGPIVLYGSGPRLRIYCIYGDDAIEGENINENPLSFVPTDGDWHMSLPCPADDLEWVQRKLQTSFRVSARDEAEPVEDDRGGDQATGRKIATHEGAVVDLDAYLRS